METEVRFADERSVQVPADAGGMGDWVWTPQGPGAYDVRLSKGRNLRVEMIQTPDRKGHVVIRVNGVLKRMQIVDGRQALLERMGMGNTESASLDRVEAPMPGKVLSVAVAAGSEVEEGDVLLVLEAMKMENVIRAPRDGRLAEVHSKTGLAVEKGALLVIYESGK